MAEIFPSEGLDILLGQFPGSTSKISTTYLCLFTSQTASTVIAYGDTLSSVTETTYTNYARQALAAATWGAPSAVGPGTGRKVTYSQITFPTCGVTGATINGFFIGEASPPTKVICQANFDDTTAVTLASGDSIKVTPYIQYNH